MHHLSGTVLLLGVVRFAKSAADESLVKKQDASSNLGHWSPLIKFPLVPVAVTLLPETGHVLAWSAGWP